MGRRNRFRYFKPFIVSRVDEWLSQAPTFEYFCRNLEIFKQAISDGVFFLRVVWGNSDPNWRMISFLKLN